MQHKEKAKCHALLAAVDMGAVGPEFKRPLQA